MNVCRITTIAIAVTIATTAMASGQGLDRAQALYEEAMAEADSARRIELLTQSFDSLATFEAAVAIGEALLEADAAPAEARRWLDDAFGLAGSGEPRARALFRLAETYKAEGEQGMYKQLLKQSLAHHRTPMVERYFRSAMSSVVSRDEVVEALTLADANLKAAVVERTIDVPIRFEFDSATLTDDGRAQTRTLGDALREIVESTGQSEGVAFLVVGHTDAQGLSEYNDQLSQRRAEVVRAFLANELGLPLELIEFEGRGEKQLLVADESDEANVLNRRVEVIRR